MKVLIINGSPKGERSDTLRLSRAFVEGMGETAELIDTMRVNVKPCLGCYACWHKTPGACVQQDDMADILQKITTSDLVIWSMPLYCYGMPSNIKVIVDRMLPLGSHVQRVDENGNTYHPTRQERDVSMMLISGSGFPDREGNFDGLIFQAKRMFGSELPMILCVESPLLNIPEAAPVADPYLDLVRQAGAAFKTHGEIPADLQSRLDAPMYPPDRYRKDCSGE